MSRISYTDNEDYPGQFALWQANVERSLAGRRGQAALRELHAAHLALPQQRLIANALVREGDVCALGAVEVLRRSGDRPPAVAIADLMEQHPIYCECGHQQEAHEVAGCRWCAIKVAVQATRPEYLRWARHCAAYVPDRDDGDDLDMEHYGMEMGFPRLVAWSIVCKNDVNWDYCTPEERYQNMLRWVTSRLRPE